MKINFFFLMLVFINHLCTAKLIVSELMPAPSGNEPEWVELFNNSNQLISFDTLYISDPSKELKLSNFILQPSQYSIITKDSAILKSIRTIPDSAVIYQISMPTLNNTTDYLLIRNNDALIDSVYYDMKWGEPGKSIERLDYDLPADNVANISASTDPTGSTAGRLNSNQKIYVPQNSDFLINEVMYDVSENGSEYIELYNRSKDSSNLLDCKLMDATGNGIHFPESIKVPPLSYIVIVWDSLIFNRFSYLQDSGMVYVSHTKISLNNGGDAVILKNPKDSTIDSIYYDVSWHNSALDYTKDVSLEKINPNLSSVDKSSWASSTDILGGTPSFINSTAKEISIADGITIEPNPFSITRSKTDGISLLYKLPFNSSFINIKIFDLNGYEVSNPFNNQFSGQSGLLVWTCTDKDGIPLPPAPYIIKFEASDTNSGNIFENTVLLVIAE